MESSTKSKRPRRSFTKQFQDDAVDLVRSSGATVAKIAKDLDLTESCLRRWVRQREVDEGLKDGLTTQEREELGKLRRENKVLREERDILKRATVFFAKETR